MYAIKWSLVWCTCRRCYTMYLPITNHTRYDFIMLLHSVKWEIQIWRNMLWLLDSYALLLRPSQLIYILWGMLQPGISWWPGLQHFCLKPGIHWYQATLWWPECQIVSQSSTEEARLSHNSPFIINVVLPLTFIFKIPKIN